MTKYLLILISLVASVYFMSCSDPTSNTVQTYPPDTHLTLYPDSIIAPGSTSKKISWWGDSPQGFIAGYRISFDGINWGYTTKQDSTFLLSISGTDSTFKFYVAAVDDRGQIDPSPASNLYPVYNSAPTIAFNYNYAVPDTVFPVVTVVWNASDPDGNSTIRNIYYSINDTNNFKPIPGNLSQMTLTRDSGLALNANNRIFIKARDNAGAYSSTSAIPDSNKTFYVKKNTGRVLLIMDTPDLSQAYTYYGNVMDTVKYDVLDIKSYGGKLTPKIVNPMFVETLKLFKVVIWSGGSGNSGNVANFTLAQASLPFYKQAGGKIIFSSGFVTNTNPNGLVDNFAAIDSISSCTIGVASNPYDYTSPVTGYPTLTASGLVLGIKNIYFSGNVVKLYSRVATTGCVGENVFMIKDNAVNPKIVYCDIPIYVLNGNAANNKLLFNKILFGEFGLN
ncbi:MAG: hypothetical protein K1X86_05950 [Ignavibacteria bacterium]|nr:hypothetical protein [Ignavibacteria bacterium]